MWEPKHWRGSRSARCWLGTASFNITRQSVRKDSGGCISSAKSNQTRIVIVGLPMMLDGTEGRSARLARQIGTALEDLGSYEIHYQDERFSTVEAEKRLIASGKSAKKKKKNRSSRCCCDFRALVSGTSAYLTSNYTPLSTQLVGWPNCCSLDWSKYRCREMRNSQQPAPTLALKGTCNLGQRDQVKLNRVLIRNSIQINSCFGDPRDALDLNRLSK